MGHRRGWWRLGLVLFLAMAAGPLAASPFMFAAPDPLQGRDAEAFDAWADHTFRTDKTLSEPGWASAYGFHGLLYDALVLPHGLQESGFDRKTNRGVIAPLPQEAIAYFRQLSKDVRQDPHLGRAFLLLARHLFLFDRSVPQSWAEIKPFTREERASLRAIATEARAAMKAPGASLRVKAAAHLLAAITEGDDSPYDSLSPQELARLPELYPGERYPVLASKWYLCYALVWRDRTREAGAVAAEAEKAYGSDPALRNQPSYGTFVRMAHAAQTGALRRQDWWATAPCYGIEEGLVLAYPQKGLSPRALPRLTLSPAGKDAKGIPLARYLMPFALDENNNPSLVAGLHKQDPRFRYENTSIGVATELRPGDSMASDDEGPVALPEGWRETYVTHIAWTSAATSPPGTATLAVQAHISHHRWRPSDRGNYGSVSGGEPLRLPMKRYELGKTYVEVIAPGTSRLPAALLLVTYTYIGSRR